MKNLSLIQKHTFYGTIFGLMFPVGATLFLYLLEGIGPIKAQITNPLLWIIDTAPLVLGVTGYIIGNKSAQTLEQQQARMDYVLKKMKVGIWKWDIENNNLTWDDSLYNLYEVDKENFTGAYDAWEKTLHPDFKETATQELQDALAGIKEFDSTFAIFTSEQKEKYIGARAKIERKADGTPYYMYGINFDKTDEYLIAKELEAEKVKMLQASKLATLGEMSAGIAHEIKNPLAIIQMSSTIIEKKITEPDLVLKRVGEIKASVRRITKIIDGLKKFAGKGGEIDMENHNSKTIINESLNLSAVRCKENYIELKLVNIRDYNILCDDVQIVQIILNLINNAIDAIKETDNPWIEVSCQCNDSDIKIMIKDSGPGINSAIHDKLFNPFFTTKEGTKGTGLGLSISQSIAKEHHGYLEYQLVDNHTAFILTIPYINTKAIV